MEKMAKNMANCPYGRCIINPKNFTKHSLVGEKKLKTLRKSSKYINEEAVTEKITEVSLVNESIVEKYPLALGQNILMESKLLLNSFIVFLVKYLREDTYTILYSGKLLEKLY